MRLVGEGMLSAAAAVLGLVLLVAAAYRLSVPLPSPGYAAVPATVAAAASPAPRSTAMAGSVPAGRPLAAARTRAPRHDRPGLRVARRLWAPTRRRPARAPLVAVAQSAPRPVEVRPSVVLRAQGVPRPKAIPVVQHHVIAHVSLPGRLPPHRAAMQRSSGSRTTRIVAFASPKSAARVERKRHPRRERFLEPPLNYQGQPSILSAEFNASAAGSAAPLPGVRPPGRRRH